MSLPRPADVPSLAALGDPLRELRARFDALVAAHRPALWRYCLRLTGSPFDAEDLVQEALTRAFARLAQSWQPLVPRAYLWRTATHAWLDAQRHARRAAEVALEEAGGAADLRPGPGLALEAVEALVHLLPPRQRVAVLLCDAFDFRAHEAAALLGCTEGALKALLHRARTALAAAPGGAGAPRAPPEPVRPDATLARFLEAFDRHDARALVALLDPGVSVEVVGAAVEEGREEAERASVATWAAHPLPQQARALRWDGREVLAVVDVARPEAPALVTLMELEVDAGRVVRWLNYYFSPDLLAVAAGELGLDFRRERPFTSADGYAFRAE